MTYHYCTRYHSRSTARWLTTVVVNIAIPFYYSCRCYCTKLAYTAAIPYSYSSLYVHALSYCLYCRNSTKCSHHASQALLSRAVFAKCHAHKIFWALYFSKKSPVTGDFSKISPKKHRKLSTFPGCHIIFSGLSTWALANFVSHTILVVHLVEFLQYMERWCEMSVHSCTVTGTSYQGWLNILFVCVRYAFTPTCAYVLVVRRATSRKAWAGTCDRTV